jgi:hypothetical protein
LLCCFSHVSFSVLFSHSLPRTHRLEQEVEEMKKQLYLVVDQQVDGLKAKLAPGANTSPYQEVMVPATHTSP